jgi:hypothetical protein
MLAAAVGYHEAQWGTSEQSLQERVNAFNQAVAAGLVAPDWKELKPGQITVRQMEQDALKEFKLLPQCITRCEELAADLRLAQRYSPKQMLENARAELVSGLAARSSELRAALSPEEQARDSQGRRAKARLLEADRVDALQRSCAGSESPEALTLALLDFERKDDALTTKHIRRLVLSKALSQITLPQEVQAALDSAQVSTNSVAALAEFFGDTIRNQILPQLFQSGLNTGDNKPLERRALQVFGVQALLDDVQRFSRSAAGNPETIGVYPTRGIIGELSGYLCDTCWAPLMQLLQNNPNITFLAFVANPETPSARLVGGSLLIRAQDQQGNTHWIVRGLNPRQNYATAVSASDLCEQLIDSYLTPQARAAGVRTIDAPNDGLGGATTNRPPIAAHFATQYLAAPALEGLRDQAELHFNGYAIQNECRVLRQLGGSVRK